MMEAHPIPQNVTSFQFKLVGDMTLKQFLYLAIGLGVAYLLFVTLGKSYSLIAWPLVIISALLGVAFAFLPIESRPLDHWLAAFLKAVYSPTKRVWQKNGRTFSEDTLFTSRLVMYLTSMSRANQSVKVSESQQTSQPTLPASAAAPAIPSTQILSTATVQPLPSEEQLAKTVDLARQAQNLQMKIIQNERTLSDIKEQAQKPTAIPVDYTQEVNKVLSDLQNLVKQASSIKQQMQKVQQPELATLPTAPPVYRAKITVVAPPKLKQTQVALTSFPNVINGVVKDGSNNYLEGVVAVIYDKEGLPVRALKTNKLGQFTGSTPLSNGTYTLELEKDNYTFDVLQIELTGGLLPPLIITAK